MAHVSEKQMIRELRKKGYRVRKAGPYVRTSVEVHKEVLKEFRETAIKNKIKMKEAFTEALELWLDNQK